MFGGKMASASTSMAPSAELPEDSIWQNKSFMAMAATQFLGAFTTICSSRCAAGMFTTGTTRSRPRSLSVDRPISPSRCRSCFCQGLPVSCRTVFQTGNLGALQVAELGIMLLAIFIFMLMREPKPDQHFLRWVWSVAFGYQCCYYY